MSPPSLLPDNWDLPHLFRERLGEAVGHQRYMVADGQLLLALHAIPADDEYRRRGRFFWFDGKSTWRSSESGEGLSALDSHLKEFEQRLTEIRDREEIAKTSKHYFELVNEISPIQRTIRHLYETLRSARKELPDLRELIDLRDDAYALDRGADLLYSDARNGLDFLIAKSTQEQAESASHMAESSHRLNILVAAFFPVATLATVFGVNMHHGLEQSTGFVPFVTMVSTGLVLGIVLTLFITNKRRSKTDL